jgi:hypothetical protein
VPSSGFLPLSTVPADSRLARGLLDPTDRRGPLRFAALFHAARVPGAPLQSFPFPGSRTHSRGPLLPCGFALRLPPAQSLRGLHDCFHRIAPSLRRTRPPEGRPGTHETGRRIPAVARPVASAHLSVPHVPSNSPPTLGSPVNGRHARFEALLPPGVRSATTSIPGQAEVARRCSPGVLRPLEFSPPRFGVRSLASAHVGGKAPNHAHLWAPSHRGCMPRPGLRRLGSRAQDPSIRRVYRTPRITVRRRPSSPNASRALECASRQPRPHTLPGVCWTERLARAPSSAAPRASLPLATGSPGRGRQPLDLEDAAYVEPFTRPRPSRDRLATEPLAELGLVVP